MTGLADWGTWMVPLPASLPGERVPVLCMAEQMRGCAFLLLQIQADFECRYKSQRKERHICDEVCFPDWQVDEKGCGVEYV